VKNKLLFTIVLFLFCFSGFSQEEGSKKEKKDERIFVAQDTITTNYDPLAPSRAAFYSAVLPGLGQAYNKKYWKIPVIYAGMGAGIYFYIDNNNEYNRFRDAFKRRLAGFTDDEFFGDGETALVSNDRLIDAQKTAKKNRDVSLIVTIAFYLINIIDANVDAHLRQYNVNRNLSFQPKLDFNPVSSQTQYNLSFTYSFN